MQWSWPVDVNYHEARDTVVLTFRTAQSAGDLKRCLKRREQNGVSSLRFLFLFGG